MTAEQATLEQVFGAVGKRYGYERVEAEFSVFRDFKVRWTRSIKWIEFQVSDYLMDAPYEVLASLAETIYSNIAGSETVGYTQDMVDWVTSEDFVMNKQPVYLRRSTRITKTPVGQNRDLTDSVNRLKAMGLIDRDADIFLSWTKEPLLSSVGYCSTLMKVIVITSAFDLECIPDIVVDYAVYHEYLTIKEGMVRFGLNDEFDMSSELERFPKSNEAVILIRRMGLHI